MSCGVVGDWFLRYRVNVLNSNSIVILQLHDSSFLQGNQMCVCVVFFFFLSVSQCSEKCSSNFTDGKEPSSLAQHKRRLRPWVQIMFV